MMEGRGSGKKWWFELTTVIGGGGGGPGVGKGAGGGDGPDDESGDERRDGESGRDGVVGKVLGGTVHSNIFFDDGEASTVVRGTVSKEEGKCGFRAVRKLMMRFNPKTPAKLFKMLGEVVSPGGAKNVRGVPKVIEEWEVEVRRLESEFQ
jgi:hypothetical protein